MSNDDRSRRVWRLLERGWTTARAFRDRVEQVREVVSEARVRISDEVVSRLSGTPVRTRSDPPRSEPWRPPAPPAYSDEAIRNEVSSAADAVSSDAVMAEAHRAAPAESVAHDVVSDVPPTGPVVPAASEDEILPVAEAVAEAESSGHDMVPRTPSGISDLPGLITDEDEAEADIDGAFNVLFTDSAPPSRVDLPEPGAVSADADASAPSRLSGLPFDIGPADIDPIAANLKEPDEDFAGMTVARRGAEPVRPAGPVFSPDLPGAWPPPPPVAAPLEAAPSPLVEQPSVAPSAVAPSAVEPSSVEQPAAVEPPPVEPPDAQVAAPESAKVSPAAQDESGVSAAPESAEPKTSAQLVALARDAEWLFVFWDTEAETTVDGERVLLRIVRIDDDQLIHQSSAALPASRRYIRVPFPDTAYRAELWVRRGDDEVRLARSPETRTPPARPQVARPPITRMMSSSAHRGVLNAAWDLSRVPRLPPEPAVSEVETASIQPDPAPAPAFDSTSAPEVMMPASEPHDASESVGSEERLAAEQSRRSGEDFQYPMASGSTDSPGDLGSEARLSEWAGLGSESRLGSKETF